MILKDDIVLLRAIEEDDARVLMDLINDPEVENSVFGWSYPVSLSSQKNGFQILQMTRRYDILLK